MNKNILNFKLTTPSTKQSNKKICAIEKRDLATILAIMKIQWNNVWSSFQFFLRNSPETLVLDIVLALRSMIRFTMSIRERSLSPVQ